MRQEVIDTQDKILMAALEDVPFDGWSWQVVQEASVKAGFKVETADAVFPEKLNDVLIHFANWADRQMMAALKDINPDEMRVRDRVAKAVELRLRALEPYKDCVQASAGYWARPLKKIDAAKLIWRTADMIWIWAGDTATDYNKYSKRGLLSGVITSTMLYWLNDKSDNMDDTLAFLNRRIDNVLRFGKITGGIVSKVQSGVNRMKQQKQ
ncbi:MAG: COQ9 family protein [Alphaproteobacteria bacterium]|nr:COQ9 family protein [Alphaproteobacteria bacterium]NCQ89261.1 COQ9 family protein [Alphaproteobacteria bacterium]NCT08400.1 COQ9 family protein [Alphaproteobacteria bacterium]